MRGAALLLPLLAAALLHAASAAGGGNGSCERRCGGMELPYPFGFSSGCTICLGCHVGADGVGAAWLGGARELGLLVRNVTSRALILDLPPDCSRGFNESVEALFSDSYAPASRNALVASSCSAAAGAAQISNCSSPPDRFLDKNTSHCAADESISIRCIAAPPLSNTSAHSILEKNASGHHFLNRSEMLRSNCTGLVSAVSYSDAQGPSLLLGALELDWWVPGRCRCAPRASCTHFTAPTTGQQAFRCECPEGLQGDGFVDGTGCWEASQVVRARQTSHYSKPSLSLTTQLIIRGVGCVHRIVDHWHLEDGQELVISPGCVVTHVLRPSPLVWRNFIG